jgi:predicted nucleic acid-binding protein
LIYLIETTSYSLLMRRNPQVRARVTALQSADRAVICPITRGEILIGSGGGDQRYGFSEGDGVKH